MGSTDIFKIFMLFMCFVFQDVPFLRVRVIHPSKKSCDWPSDPHTFLREENYALLLSVTLKEALKKHEHEELDENIIYMQWTKQGSTLVQMCNTM